MSLTFDVDAESALDGSGPGRDVELLGLFRAAVWGCSRICRGYLAFLADEGIKGTFYVPGYTAERYPDEVGEIVEQGHELAHHGYFHRPPNRSTPQGSAKSSSVA